MLRFPFPPAGSYMLQQDAAYILPIGNSGPFDIDPVHSLLWMVQNDEVRDIILALASAKCHGLCNYQPSN